MAVGWKETIRKLESELEKIEERERRLAENKKELRAKLAAAKKSQEEEKNKKIASLVEDQIGDLSDEKLGILKIILEDHADLFQKEESEPEENIPWKEAAEDD